MTTEEGGQGFRAQYVSAMAQSLNERDALAPMPGMPHLEYNDSGMRDVGPMPELQQKLDLLAQEVVPSFQEACRTLARMSARVGYAIDPTPESPTFATKSGKENYIDQLAHCIGQLRETSETLNAVLSEMSRLI